MSTIRRVGWDEAVIGPAVLLILLSRPVQSGRLLASHVDDQISVVCFPNQPVECVTLDVCVILPDRHAEEKSHPILDAERSRHEGNGGV